MRCVSRRWNGSSAQWRSHRCRKRPAFVVGVINVQGQITPVVVIRRRLGLPPREISPDDRFILARTSRRLVALVADSVEGVHELTDRESVSAEQVLPGAAYIHGLAKLGDNLVLICDLDQFLTFDDERKLVEALAEIAPEPACKTRQTKGEAV